jgi:hypothetical protein
MILQFPEMKQPDETFLKLAESVYSDHEYGSPWEEQFRLRCGKSERTIRRWLEGERLPGPVKAMILAHAKCQRYGIAF